MIRHIIKLIWNKKRSNFLLTTEVFASFIVLFGVMSLFFYNLGNFAQPLGYDYEKVWAIYFNNQGMSDSLFAEALERSRRQMINHPEIAEVSRSSFNTPYSVTSMQWSMNHENRRTHGEFIATDEHFPEVMDLNMEEGRWFDPAEVASAQAVLVLNRQARKALFGDGPALGKEITFESNSDQTWKVVGVTGNFKPKGEFQEEQPMAFLNHKAYHFTAGAFLVEVKESADAAFEAALLNELNDLAGGANIELSYLSDQRRSQHNLVKVPLIIASIVTGFLLLNVALGLLSVLWYNIRKRREEIGLRRALGATQEGILGHFIGEALVIALFGIAIGLFFAVQLPVLDVFNIEKGIYFKAIGASVFILAFLVILCALYPSRAAAKVQPAEVLHEE